MTVLDVHPGAAAFNGFSRLLQTWRDRVDIYRRHIRAGLEIDALLALTDQRLADCGLAREDVGRTIMAKHGIGLGTLLVESLGSSEQNG